MAGKSSNILPATIGVTIEMAAVWLGHEILAPGVGFAASAVAQYLFHRGDIATTILRSELERAGAEDFQDAEQFAAAAVRYMRAARDQAANENLTILAQAMIGCARRQELWASDFLRYADILAPLSRDELILIGVAFVEDKTFEDQPRPEAPPVAVAFELWKTIVDKAAPKLGGSQSVWATAAQAQRSGIVTLEAGGFGGVWFSVSPLGRRIRDIVDIDRAVSEAQRHEESAAGIRQRASHEEPPS